MKPYATKTTSSASPQRPALGASGGAFVFQFFEAEKKLEFLLAFFDDCIEESP